MKNNLLLYFSKTGNTRFIANRISQKWNCEVKEIKCPIQSIGFLFFLSALNWKIRTNIKKGDIEPYSEVLVMGPIWGGKVISPLRSVLKKCRSCEKLTHFAVTCESREEDKNDKYGIGGVLKNAQSILGPRAGKIAAFSTALVAPEGYEPSLDPEKKVHFTRDNFRGEISNRVENFVRRLNEKESNIRQKEIADKGN